MKRKFVSGLYSRVRVVTLLVAAVLLTCLTEVSARENRFYVYNAANGLADNSAQTIHCTKTGRLVITTMGQINFFDGQKFIYIDPSKENLYPLADYKGNYHLYFDKRHHIWLKNTHNVTCVNLLTERFADSIDKEFREMGVDEQVRDLFVDTQNDLWLLTQKGLFCVDTKRTYQVRRGLDLQDVDVYQDKFLLLFYHTGLLEVLELGSGEKVYESAPYGQQEARRFDRSSVLFSDGSSFFQIRNGEREAVMLRFDIGKWEWTTLLETPYHLNNIAQEDSVLYIPSEYGYWTYDRTTGKTDHVERLVMAAGGTLLTDMNAIAFDKQGGMWIGTEKRGLLYARPIASPFNVYTWNDPEATELAVMMDKHLKPVTQYRGKRVNCVFRDSRGWDWVGTESGLQCYRKSSDRLPQVITRNEGLLNNVVHTIIEDGSHNIWVGTSYGICCLLIKDGKLRYINSYNQWDKVPNESFVNGRAIRLSDGTIAMQMLDHMIAFNPDRMVTITKDVSYELHPKLIRLLVNGNDIRTGEELDGNVILERALTRTKEINLNYNQNSVSLTFSALNYFRPQQTYYRVRISGLDHTWRILSRHNSGGLVDSQGMLHLPMVALRPGSYVIEVQTSMVPDEWNTVPYEWVININEPWWRTTGIFALLGLVLAVLFVLNAYYYLHNARMRATRDSEEKSLIKRIKTFVERCSNRGGELLEPIPEEYLGQSGDSQGDLAPEFIDTMIRMMPLVLSKNASQLSMHELSSEVGMDVQRFYQLIMANIYKSPRPLARQLMLSKAEELLRTSDKTIAEISEECGFVTPNYFIATFFRQRRMTPDEFRRQR